MLANTCQDQGGKITGLPTPVTPPPDLRTWQEKAMELTDSDAREADYRSRLDLYEQRKPARVEGRSID